MPPDYDVIIVGGGAAGVHAAHPLVAAGLRVLMLDGGISPPAILRQPPPGDFLEMRERSYEQIRWFVGEDLSQLPAHTEMNGMIGGNRGFVTRHTESLLPLQPHGQEEVTQTLAEGGLASAWGGACTYFDDAQLRNLKLPPEEMRQTYADVTKLIGVSGPEGPAHVQPPLNPDHHARLLLQRSKIRSIQLSRMGASVRQPYTAILTQALGDRQPCAYEDLEYYSDAGRSLYRANFTLEKLRRSENFTYRPNVRVEEIKETEESVSVCGHHFMENRLDTPLEERAKRVILAAGAVGTGRILLRSLSLCGLPLPFISKPHVLTACLHPRTLGRAGDAKRSGLCQLLVTIPGDTDRAGACAQLYSYRSFLLYRLLPHLPLSLPESMDLLSLLTPSLLIAGIRFGCEESNGRMTLSEDGVLSVEIPQRLRTDDRYKHSLRHMKRALRTLGLLPFQTRTMPEGSAFHYAGTVPVDADVRAPLAANQDGLIRGLKRTYIADASLFPVLPAEPHTLTIMANARRIGQKIAQQGNL